MDWRNAGEYEDLAFEDIRPGDRIHTPSTFYDGEPVAWTPFPIRVTGVEERAPRVWFVWSPSYSFLGWVMLCDRVVRAGVKRAKPATDLSWNAFEDWLSATA